MLAANLRAVDQQLSASSCCSNSRLKESIPPGRSTLTFKGRRQTQMEKGLRDLGLIIRPCAHTGGCGWQMKTSSTIPSALSALCALSLRPLPAARTRLDACATRPDTSENIHAWHARRHRSDATPTTPCGRVTGQHLAHSRGSQGHCVRYSRGEGAWLRPAHVEAPATGGQRASDHRPP
eukprot:3789793-Pyramimonas_sp.AAC.1